MAKRTRRNRLRRSEGEASGYQGEVAVEDGGWRERLELILFVGVEVICLLLFVDFLFIGYFVK